jgi:hypothetical protein
MLASINDELTRLEDKTGLCLCRKCAPLPYRVSRSH